MAAKFESRCTDHSGLPFRYVRVVGRELVNLYNDSYRPLLGTKHPAALGKPARQVWGRFGIKSDRDLESHRSRAPE
jgi:hypothetical protein